MRSAPTCSTGSGDHDRAAQEYRAAAELTGNDTERRYLLRRAEQAAEQSAEGGVDFRARPAY